LAAATKLCIATSPAALVTTSSQRHTRPRSGSTHSCPYSPGRTRPGPDAAVGGWRTVADTPYRWRQKQ
jgi:hypothetical protein